MSPAFKQHFPYAACAITPSLLLVGDGTLAILALAASIALLPLAFARDVDEIARLTREGAYRH
jgi:hypothetical protein